ncbi:HAD family hydrolase [Lacrimispora defluvii]|uniref:HAD family phosphatase n=1 Tax=Lacrimispora defluvii TaxID=2719233 RepID=A0ABX1VVJ9_9FIRM|nr:HAD family phosphatase [Lacrimispora defluvii]NNJ30857.1 HAD family phosphatase [Lacrimispora defluvii]
MIKGIIFDMDGVIFDTEWLSTCAWLEVGNQLNIDLPLAFINSFKGCSAKTSEALFKERFGQDFDYVSARAKRTQYMKEYISQKGVPIKKGLFQLLNYLQDNQIKRVVATSTDRKLTEFYLNSTGVLSCLDGMITGDCVEKSKPDPEIFIKAKQLIESEAEECFVIEDSPAGIYAGEAAGIRVIHIPDQVVVNQMVKSKIYKICNNLAEVIQVIENENAKKDG